MSLLSVLCAAWLQGPSAHCEPLPAPSPHPWRLALLGAPGVGKGTQADLLNKRLRACHLSTGDIFRAAKGRAECELSPAMRAALEYMRRGDLVPDSTVWDLVRERGACLHCGGGFILDGFPRTLNQAQSLKALMINEGLALTAVVKYELPVVEIISRLSGGQTWRNANPCSTRRSALQKSRVSAIAVVASCLSARMTGRNRSRPAS